jgi:hypothetical protein
MSEWQPIETAPRDESWIIEYNLKKAGKKNLKSIFK